MDKVKLDLIIQQGATFTKVFRWTKDDAPVDITTASFVGHAKVHNEQNDVVINFSTNEDTVQIMDGDGGKFLLYLDEEFTESLNPNVDLVYDLKINLQGNTYILIYGDITIESSPTKQFQ